jgi:hypothetical protein
MQFWKKNVDSYVDQLIPVEKYGNLLILQTQRVITFLKGKK